MCANQLLFSLFSFFSVTVLCGRLSCLRSPVYHLLDVLYHIVSFHALPFRGLPPPFFACIMHEENCGVAPLHVIIIIIRHPFNGFFPRNPG